MPSYEIVSPKSAVFFVGIAGDFEVVTEGEPIPSISAGGLPSGTSFTDNGDGTGNIRGVPNAGSAGTYSVSITAGDASQTLSLVVLAAQQLTSTTSVDPNVTGPYSLPGVTGNLFSSDQCSANYYSHFSASVGYGRHEGKYAMPVAAPPSQNVACQIVQLHGPIATKVITWTVEREGQPPQAPHPATLDANSVLLNVRHGAATPVLQTSGQARTWRMTGEYTYALKTPPALASDITVPGSPADTTPTSQNVYPGTNFNQGLTP